MTTLAITGYGRSGTMFLARALNTDPEWQVEHEPTGGFVPLRQVQSRFDQAKRDGRNYGEVNSWLRFCFAGLKVDTKRIILRDPWQILQSVYNRRHSVDLPDLVQSLHVLNGLITWGISFISFSRMTTDPDYLRWEAKKLAIHIGNVDLATKVNASEPGPPLPQDVLRKAEKHLSWFREIYRSRW